MTIGSEYYRSCVSQFSTSTLVSAADFTSDMDDDASTAVIGAQPVQTIVSRGVAIADPISVAWRLSDMSILPSEYASSIVKRFGVSAMALSADSPRVSPPPAQQGPASSTPTSGTSSSRTSPRTIGIAVGVGVGALILIVGLVWFFLKRRQRRKQAAALESAIPEMEDQNKNYGAQFVNGKWINEAEVVEPKHEIDSRGLPMPPRSPQELDGVAITAEMPESGTPNSTRHLV